jgi:hypothetical protein
VAQHFGMMFFRIKARRTSAKEFFGGQKLLVYLHPAFKSQLFQVLRPQDGEGPLRRAVEEEKI